MAKQHKTKSKKLKPRNRQYMRHKHKREFRAKSNAENYYKEQAKIINKLKPVMAAAKRVKERRDENASKEVE